MVCARWTLQLPRFMCMWADDCASPRALKSLTGLWVGKHLALGISVVLPLPTQNYINNRRLMLLDI